MTWNWLTKQWISDSGRLVTILASLVLLLCWTLAPTLIIRFALPLGLAITVLYNLLLVYRCRQQLLLTDLLSLWALLGMWVAPAIQYWLEAQGLGLSAFTMPVSREAYFSIVLPGLPALLLGTQLRLFPFKTDDHPLFQRAVGQLEGRIFQPAVLAGVGILAFLVAPWLPSVLSFVGYLGQSLLWVAMLQACFLPASPGKFLIISMGLLIFAIQAIVTTLFADLVLGLGGIALYLLLYHPPRLRALLLGQVVAFLAVCWLMTFKYEYREQAYKVDGLTEKIGLFSRVSMESLTRPFSKRSLDHIMTRLNQGAISAVAFKYVPDKQPFVYGETIKTAVLCALVPRVLYPNKPQAGGAENRRRFMGIENLPYSINMGVFGEAYVNFGPQYGAWFLLLYGLIIRVLYDGFRILSSRFTSLFFFLPFIFMPAISIETDVLMVLNHLVKAGMVALACGWFFSKYKGGSTFHAFLSP